MADNRALRRGAPIVLAVVAAACAGARPGAASEARSLAFVAHQATDAVSVVDGEAVVVTAVVPVGDGIRPSAVALSADGRRAFVMNGERQTLTTIDVAAHRITADVPVGPFTGSYLHDVAVAADGTVYVAAGGSGCGGGVAVVRDGRQVTTLPLIDASAVAVSADGQRLYAAGEYGLAVVDTATRHVVRTTDARVTTLVADPDGRHVYGRRTRYGPTETLVAIDTERDTIATLSLPDPVLGLGFSPDGTLVYAGQYDHLAVLDAATRRVVGTVELPGHLRAFGVSPDGATALAVVAACGDGQCELRLVALALADGALLADVPFDVVATDIVFAADGSTALVLHPGAALSVVDLQPLAVRERLPLHAPALQALATPAGHLLVATRASIAAVDPAAGRVAAELVGAAPQALATTPDGQRVVSADTLSNTLSVIDTARAAVVARVPVGERPLAVAVAPDGQRAYVSCYLAGRIDVVDLDSAAVIAGIPTSDACGSGSAPMTLAISADGGTAYGLARGEDDEVVFVDLRRGAIAGRLRLGYGVLPTGLAASADGATLYVAVHRIGGEHTDTPGILVVDTATRTLRETRPLDERPEAVLVDDTGRLLVATDADRILVLGPDLEVIADPIALRRPRLLAAAPGDNLIYAASRAPAMLTAITADGATHLAGVALDGPPDALAVARVPGAALPPPTATATVTPTPLPSGGPRLTAYVAGSDHSLARVDLTSGTVTSVPLPNPYVGALALAPDGHSVYVVGQEPGELIAVDTSTGGVRGTVPLRGAGRAAVGPDGMVYVAQTLDASLAVIDPASLATVAVVPVGAAPDGVAVTPDGSAIYVANRGSRSVSIVDRASLTVAESVVVGPGPGPIAMSAGGARAYVLGTYPDPDASGCSLSVIDTTTRRRVAAIPLPLCAAELALSPDERAAYLGSLSCGNTLIRQPLERDEPAVLRPLEAGMSAVATAPDGSAVYAVHWRCDGDGCATVLSAFDPLTLEPGGSVALADNLSAMAVGFVPGRPAAPTASPAATATRAPTAGATVTTAPPSASPTPTSATASPTHPQSPSPASTPTPRRAGDRGGCQVDASATAAWPALAIVPLLLGRWRHGRRLLILAMAIGAPAGGTHASEVLYVSNFFAGTVSVVDPGAGVERVIALPGGTTYLGAMALSPDGAELYVAAGCAGGNCVGTGAVFAIETVSGAVRWKVPGVNPVGIAVDRGYPAVWAAFAGDDFFGFAPEVARIPVPYLGIGERRIRSLDPLAPDVPIGAPAAVLAGAGGRAVYVADGRYASVYAVEPSTAAVVAVIPVSGVGALAEDPSGRAVYVVDTLGQRLSVIDPATRTVGRVIPLSVMPAGRLVVSHDGRTGYLPAYAPPQALLVALDLASGIVRSALPLRSPPSGLALSRDGATLYATDSVADEIVIIDAATATVSARVAAGDQPTALVVGTRRDPSCAGRCTGDCNGDCRVDIDELVTSVGIVAGIRPEQMCFALDHRGIDALVGAVHASLAGCAATEGGACIEDVECAPGVCRQARCTRRALGEDCASGAQCASNACDPFDQICCERLCHPNTEFCDRGGRCRPFPARAAE